MPDYTEAVWIIVFWFNVDKLMLSIGWRHIMWHIVVAGSFVIEIKGFMDLAVSVQLPFMRVCSSCYNFASQFSLCPIYLWISGC
jgi:hypothetical protein